MNRQKIAIMSRQNWLICSQKVLNVEDCTVSGMIGSGILFCIAWGQSIGSIRVLDSYPESSESDIVGLIRHWVELDAVVVKSIARWVWSVGLLGKSLSLLLWFCLCRHWELLFLLTQLRVSLCVWGLYPSLLSLYICLEPGWWDWGVVDSGESDELLLGSRGSDELLENSLLVKGEVPGDVVLCVDLCLFRLELG